MSKRFEQKKIALANLVDDLAPPISEAKVGRIKKAMQQGAKLPPIVVVERGGEYSAVDGNHRLNAAASLGHKNINAVVFHVETDAEANLVSELADALSGAGVPWTEALRVIDAMLSMHTISVKDAFERIFAVPASERWVAFKLATATV